MSDTPTETKHSGYGQILSSSLFTGGAQVVTMLGAFVRMKIAAVFIGPGGVGLIGLILTAESLDAVLKVSLINNNL